MRKSPPIEYAGTCKPNSTSPWPLSRQVILLILSPHQGRNHTEPGLCDLRTSALREPVRSHRGLISWMEVLAHCGPLCGGFARGKAGGGAGKEVGVGSE